MSGENSRHKGDVRSTRLNPQTDRKYTNYRDENELTDSGAVRRLIRRGIEAGEEDTLDKLEVDEELRDRVEEAREEAETLDDAVRRLLRAGVDASGNSGPASLKQRILGALGVVLLMIAPVGSALIGDGGTAVLFVFFYASLILFNPQLSRVEKYISDKFSSLEASLRG